MRPTKAKATAAARTERGLGQLVSLAVLGGLIALLLAGCNTMSGVGEDISAAGGALEQTSERTQDRIDGDPQAQQPTQQPPAQQPTQQQPTQRNVR